MQLAAHDAVPVAAKMSEGAAVQELQKDSKLEKLAVYCCPKALSQLFDPQLGLSS